MKIRPILCKDAAAKKLMKKCLKNLSDDTVPFHMSHLQIFDLETPSPITKQTIEGALSTFFENLPEGIFKDYLNKREFNEGKLIDKQWYFREKEDFDKSLKGWLTSYSEQVRSPIRKEHYEEFISSLYNYLGRPAFFVKRGGLFDPPNYYCPNINAIIVTQNHGKYPIDKLAMFSFFCPD